MLVKSSFPIHRLLFFFGCSVFAVGLLNLFSSQVIYRIPATMPTLFPVMTIFLMVFHFLIASFMVMKYLCDKHRLYLMAIACAFGGSALLMLGTLSSYTDWLLCSPIAKVNYNDAFIYYFFRNVMMAVLFIASIILYKYRHSEIHTLRNHIVILALIIGFTVSMLTLSWLYSSHYGGMHLLVIDNLSRHFTSLWHNYLISALIALWCLTLLTMLVITRLRNIFWFSGYFFCIFYIFTLYILQPALSVEGYGWYQSRLFETFATLFLILILLCDVFTLYRESNNKYEDSYQNSIRDPMTRLYNRSFFYDSLRTQMSGVSNSTPVSVIVCDLDHFKRINDRYGHLQGDKVIQCVADILQNAVRKGDVAARIGGEEFALLLANTDAENAHAIAERIRKSVSVQDALDPDRIPEPVTISMGIYTATQAEASQEICVQRADEAMYQAKENGRNQVIAWQA
ncbi:GGDEF domain-containing protein [Scandinavium sp. NPDC088450]|uniref:sensor domain-containing diguanylate cyclase n=1 Tax=Scandinavium sp. NPDC088450 TaxID=3364514 RepID=UPI00384ED193